MVGGWSKISVSFIRGSGAKQSTISMATCPTAGVEPWEHAAHPDIAETREGSTLACGLAGLCVHWLRGHGDQGACMYVSIVQTLNNLE
jgi:hypothetical protein